MCGIAGILNLDGHVSTDSSHIKRMADVMVHRGPNDEGFFVSGPIHLAHRRLSIIDLTSGRQPMFNEDNSMVVVFNGEIYNGNSKIPVRLSNHRCPHRIIGGCLTNQFEQPSRRAPAN